MSTRTRIQADDPSESLTTSIACSWEYYQGYGEGRRRTRWELAARLFDNEPDLELVVETVYYGEQSSYPEAIAAIILGEP